MFPLLFAAAALAFEVPSYVPGDAVYLSPPGHAFSTRQVGQAVTETERPVYVVVFAEVIDGTIGAGHESETEDAIEAVWDAWVLAPGEGEQAFDPVEGALIVLGVDDREVRVRMGSRWDAELGLHNDALLPVIDTHFLPTAKAGDLDGGLAKLAVGVDKHITWRQEALVEEAAAAKRAEEAAAALEIRREEERVERAARLEALRIETEKRNAERLAAAKTIAAMTLALLLFGGLAVLGIRRRSAAQQAREAFEAAASARRQQLDRAEGAVAELFIDVELRDRIVALKLKGERSTACVEQVTALLDEIRVGITGLRSRLDAVVSGVEASAWSQTPWRGALTALDASFDYDTGEVRETLFGEPTQVVHLEPEKFISELEEKWARAKALWDRALDAVEASLRTARQDLPTDDLVQMRTALDEAGISQKWLDDHPLQHDAEGAWAELDALRVSDPVHYLDALDAATECDDTLEQVVAGIIGAATSAREARAEAEEPATDHLDTIVHDPLRDPSKLAAAADEALAALERQLADVTSFEAVDEAADRAIAEALALHEARAALEDAVTHGEEHLGKAASALSAVEREINTQRSKVRSLLEQHVPSSLDAAWREFEEAAVDLVQGEEALTAAHQALHDREHLRAMDLVEQLVDETKQAARNLGELYGILTELERARTQATILWTTLDTIRTGHEHVLSRYGEWGKGKLEAGDAKRKALEDAWEGPQDWKARALALAAVQTAWSTGITEAKDAYQRQQERLRQEREAKAAARRAARASSSYSSSFGSSSTSRSSRSSYRSSRSSSSRSSSRSSSSSSRSSSRSYSSSSRSSGRSYSSSKRSGGRKF